MPRKSKGLVTIGESDRFLISNLIRFFYLCYLRQKLKSPPKLKKCFQIITIILYQSSRNKVLSLTKHGFHNKKNDFFLLSKRYMQVNSNHPGVNGNIYYFYSLCGYKNNRQANNSKQEINAGVHINNFATESQKVAFDSLLFTSALVVQ